MGVCRIDKTKNQSEWRGTFDGEQEALGFKMEYLKNPHYKYLHAVSGKMLCLTKGFTLQTPIIICIGFITKECTDNRKKNSKKKLTNRRFRGNDSLF